MPEPDTSFPAARRFPEENALWAVTLPGHASLKDTEARLFTQRCEACNLRRRNHPAFDEVLPRMSYESSSGSNPPEHEEPLSATAMFLRSLESPPATTEESPASGVARPVPEPARSDWPAQAVPPPSPAAKSGPGEFTRIFQTMDKQAIEKPATGKLDNAVAPAPAQVSAAKSEPATAPAASSGPGEFTRIFVAGSVPLNPVAAKTVIEPPPLPPSPPQAQFTPPATPPAPSKMKGFSNPGVSDSASAEGSFTQIFKPAAPSSSAPAAAGSATGIFAGSTPASAHTPARPETPPESKPEPRFGSGFDSKPAPSWNPEPQFASPAQPPSASHAPAGITGLVSALSTPAAPVGARPSEPVPYRPDPVPAYTPQAPAASAASTPEAGSVTRLISRLSQVEPAAPPPPPVAPAVAPPVSSGPGEFTRMISMMAPAANAAAAAAPAAPSPAAPPPAPAPAMAMPQVHLPAMPAVPPQPAAPPPSMHLPHPPMPPPAQAHFQAPKVELPKPPAMAAPAVAAPKGKLEAMVPILLVINTFLLIVLLVVVIFAMRR